MSETAAEICDQLKVGEGWLYQCWACDHYVTTDAALPERCPGCGAGGWWGHLVTPREGIEAEIKLRAERRAGEMLREADKNEGGNPNLLHDETGSPPTLDELGISRIQSHRWQAEAENKVAKMPGGIKTCPGFLSHQNNDVARPTARNNGPVQHSLGQGRGRPRRGIPGDLIDQLSQQGLGSRQIAAELATRGFVLSYKSIQRYFKRQQQGSFPL
jgi:hypothetical protein